MSHCGLSGMTEAVITGTPAGGYHARFCRPATERHLGVGVPLEVETVTKETVLTALNTIINDTR